MALIDAESVPIPRPASGLPGRVRNWLKSDNSLAQRMAGTAFVIRVLSAAVVFLSQIFLARWMGSVEYGSYVYVWTWLLLVGDIVHLGLPLTAQKHIPEYTQHNAIERLRGYLVGSRWIVFAAGTLAGLAGGVAVHSLDGAIDPTLAWPFYLACVALPFYALSFMLDGLARTYNNVMLAIVPHSLLRPVLLFAIIGSLHLSGYAVDATTAMLSLAAAVWITTLLQLVLFNRMLSRIVPPGAKSFDLRGWFTTAAPIFAVWSFYTALTCTDVLVLKHFRPADEVAHYFAAAKVLALVQFVYFSVAATVAHRFTEYHVAGDRAGLADFATRSIRWIFWPSLAATLALLAIGKPMLWLFGPSFTEAYPVMFVLALGLLSRALVGPAERVLTMAGQQRICALAYAAAFAVNLTGCILLAGPYGGIGVAAATATAFMVESALMFAIAKRRLGLHMFIWRRG